MKLIPNYRQKHIKIKTDTDTHTNATPPHTERESGHTERKLCIYEQHLINSVLDMRYVCVIIWMYLQIIRLVHESESKWEGKRMG